jgi:hypothetical protein
VASLRNIDTAEIAYSSTYPSVGFAPDLNSLGPGGTSGASPSSSNACLLDNVLGCTSGVGTAVCQKSGYSFHITAGTDVPLSSYSSNANPIFQGQTGVRNFYSDSTDVIRFNSTAPATLSDPPIQ